MANRESGLPASYRPYFDGQYVSGLLAWELYLINESVEHGTGYDPESSTRWPDAPRPIAAVAPNTSVSAAVARACRLQVQWHAVIGVQQVERDDGGTDLADLIEEWPYVETIVQRYQLERKRFERLSGFSLAGIEQVDSCARSVAEPR